MQNYNNNIFHKSVCCFCGNKGIELYKNLEDRLFIADGSWNIYRCGNVECGVMWLDPTPLTSELDKAYDSYYTHDTQSDNDGRSLLKKAYYAIREGYLGKRFGYPSASWKRPLWPLMYLHPGARAHADFNIVFMPYSERGKSLLEIGFGGGVLLDCLTSFGWNVEGVDTDIQAVSAAKDRGLNVHLGTLQAQQYPDQFFDLVILSHVIEHVIDPASLLDECHRILKSDGKIVIATPNSNSLGHMVFRDAWLHLDPPRHLFLFNANALKYIVSRAGFGEISVLNTSLRNAGATFNASCSIRKSGKYDINSKLSVLQRILFHVAYYVEWTYLNMKSMGGEELVLIARK